MQWPERLSQANMVRQGAPGPQLALPFVDSNGHNQLSEWNGFGTAISRLVGLHEKLGKALEVRELH